MSLDSKFGLSDQDIFFEAYFNEPSESLIQHTGRQVLNGYIKSLFCRQLHQDKYELLAAGGNDLSYEDCIIASSSPFVYANVFSIREMGDEDSGKSLAHEWKHIEKINIATKEETILVSKDSINMGGGENELWVSQLLSLGDKEQSLICISGSISSADTKKRDIEYNLCKLEFGSLAFSVISRMLDPSF